MIKRGRDCKACASYLSPRWDCGGCGGTGLAPKPWLAERETRCAQANEFLHVVASCGRKFFASSDGKRVDRLEVDHRGRVWFLNECRARPREPVYTHHRGRWRHFSHGGTLKRLVEALRDFVTKGAKLPLGILGPWPDWICGNGDLWGYGADMEKVRQAAADLGLTRGEAS